MQEYKNNGMQFKEWLNNKEEVMAYILGIQALVLMVSNIFIIMLARSLQAKLFYPQGFKKEMLNMQVHPTVIVGVICMLLGVYYKYPIFISILPVWLAYLCGCGISVLVNIFATNRALLVFFLLLVLISLMPIFALTLLIGVGSLDSVINFRTLIKNGNFTNKSS